MKTLRSKLSRPHEAVIAPSGISNTRPRRACVRAWRALQVAAGLALFALLTVSAAIAQSDSVAKTSKSAELEKKVLEIVQMFESDPRYKRGRTPQQIKDSVEFVTGNMLFVLAHVTGHALISVLELPVIGREGDAADSLATILAMKMANPFADRVVVNAARAWFLSDQRDKKAGSPTPMYDEHGLDLQRAYNIVCLLVGGEPSKFMALANEVKLPAKRQATCQFDFSNASWSWDEALKPHLRKPDDPKSNIEVKYAPTAKYRDVLDVSRKLQILEIVAQWLSEEFIWKTPISMGMQQCGPSLQTRWLRPENKIIVCYEMVREFIQLYREFGQASLGPEPVPMAKYETRSRLATSNKIRKSNAFRSARVRVPDQIMREENPGGGM